MDAIRRYITEALEELNHVRWPTRQQAVRLSVIVLIFTAICTAAFGALDFILAQGLKMLLTVAQ